MSTKKYELDEVYNYKFTQQSTDSIIIVGCQQRLEIKIEEIKTEPKRKHARTQTDSQPTKKMHPDIQCNVVSSSSSD